MLGADEQVGHADADGVGAVETRRGQTQEHAHSLRHAIQKITAADIGKQADSDLRHRHLGALGDDAASGAVHDADTAAHGDTVGPTEQRFRVAVN